MGRGCWTLVLLVGCMGVAEAQHAGKLVSHHLALPRLLKALGHPAEVAIALHEYDNLFVLVPKTEGGPMVLRLRY